ncbi:hypothetical protein C8245_23120 [Paracidovorax avenae]|uniref:hypothetical protein n=1 Tax=Paracidovorax avenae TaxID=80867 RepID=UPI000D20786E|nr:hypothetical protein [Paracidovorax avenae]AVS68169.1 hypothetical protein C8245_23120 [Paracidovorax avenae]
MASDARTTSAPAATPDLQTVVKYLCGEGPLCGVWFGDGPPAGEKGSFWWRHYLRAALAAPAAQEAEPEMATPCGADTHLAALKTYEPDVVIKEDRGRLKATGAAMAQKEGGQWVRLSDVRAALIAPAAQEAEPAGIRLLSDPEIQEAYMEACRRTDATLGIQPESSATGRNVRAEHLLHIGRAFEEAVFRKLRPWLDAAPRPQADAGAVPEDLAYLINDLDELASDLMYEGNQAMSAEMCSRAALIDRGVRSLRSLAAASQAPAAAVAPAEAVHKAAVDHAHEILGRLLYHRDGDYFVNVNRAGAEAMHVSTVSTIVHAALIGAAAPTQEAEDGLTQAARDVLAERRRQVEAEGWTSEHDDQYPPGTMARAAGCYATINTYPTPTMWPWAPEWWKPRDDRSNYVRAAALLIAELESLDRAAARARQEGGGA